MRVYYFFLISILSISAYPVCKKKDFVFQTKTGIKKLSDIFCKYGDYYFSNNCKAGECIGKSLRKELKYNYRIKSKEVLSKFGTVEFKLCKEIGGIGQIISVKEGSKSVKSARCIYKNHFFEANYLNSLVR